MNSVRSAMRRQRAGLSKHEVRTLSAAITRRALNHRALMRAKNIACYLAVAGEVDCTGLLRALRLRGKRTFLPVLEGRRLLFAPYNHRSRFANNRYGIPEPVVKRSELLTPEQLDVVFAPLVAFDTKGNRLGMGGGFYDRSFAFRRNSQRLGRTRLIGLAYEFQRVDQLHTEHWDVPLDEVITEREIYIRSRN